MRCLIRRSRGFTLIEAAFTSTIALVAGLAIIGAFVYISRAQQIARQRTMAQRVATSVLEDAHRKAFNNLITFKDRPVVIDDNRTPDYTNDDINGWASLIVRRASDGVELPSAVGEDYVTLEAQVTWWFKDSQVKEDPNNPAPMRRVSIVSQKAP